MSSTENNYVNTDLGNVALNSCGEYNADSSYEYLDTVNYEGGSYFCKVEFPKKISGIAPKAGVSTEFWQLLTIPGDATSEYIKLHDEVVNKAKQVETSRAAVELSQTEVEAAQADVSQMRQDTQEASEEAAVSRDSAAGYAQSAEASRTAAKESEDNINAQVTGFDTHVAEKTSAAETAITEARRAAVSAVSTKQDNVTQAVTDEGDKQMKNVEDAGTEQVGKVKSAGGSAVSAAGAAGVSAVNAVKAQQTASIKAVADKGTQQVTAVNTAGSTQVSTIETKGADQVKAIKEAGENAFQNISNGVDKGLSEEGKAADAKATGEAISKLTEDIGNQEDKLEPIVKSKQDLKDAFYIVDIYGNIICKVDKDGVHASGFDGKNLALNDVISTYEDSFYISDSNGNVIFKADKDGVRGLNMGASSGIDSPFKGMKLLTIGDSLSAHNNWQKWLVEWLGVTFDNDENINGKDGHKPMAKGGTAIAPTAEDSIYMRSLDAKYYADDTNGTVIIIYAGQNDSVALGTIDDTPYTDKTVTASSSLTFYSSYMGMIENILEDIPFARIYLMTQMPVRLEIGMTGTVDPYIGVIRFPDMTSVLAYEASRYKKVEAIRAISRKYSLPCIDLWEDSGINDYNSKYWYGAVGGTCGQVHPNNIGYKRMAEVAVAKMY